MLFDFSQTDRFTENGNCGSDLLRISFKNGNSVKWKFGTLFFTKPPEMEFHFIAKALYVNRANISVAVIYTDSLVWETFSNDN